jgi:nitrite reductase/ring-hydroxylating ferredoxin subunit
VSCRLLCRSDDIPEGAAKGFARGSGTVGGVVVVRRAGRFHGYVNACPHLGTPLNFLPDRFLDRDGTRLLCATHGALFRIEDGFCERGPCRGASLAVVEIEDRAGELLLLEDSAGASPA